MLGVGWTIAVAWRPQYTGSLNIQNHLVPHGPSRTPKLYTTRRLCGGEIEGVDTVISFRSLRTRGKKTLRNCASPEPETVTAVSIVFQSLPHFDLETESHCESWQRAT